MPSATQRQPRAPDEGQHRAPSQRAGVVSPWAFPFGDAQRSPQAPAGEFAVQVTGTTVGLNSGREIFQRVAGPYAAGDAFFLSARIRPTSGSASGLTVAINDGGYPDAELPFVGSTEWEDLEGTIVLTEDAATLPLSFKTFVADQTVLVDELVVRPACP